MWYVYFLQLANGDIYVDSTVSVAGSIRIGKAA